MQNLKKLIVVLLLSVFVSNSASSANGLSAGSQIATIPVPDHQLFLRHYLNQKIEASHSIVSSAVFLEETQINIIPDKATNEQDFITLPLFHMGSNLKEDQIKYGVAKIAKKLISGEPIRLKLGLFPNEIEAIKPHLVSKGAVVPRLGVGDDLIRLKSYYYESLHIPYLLSQGELDPKKVFKQAAFNLKFITNALQVALSEKFGLDSYRVAAYFEHYLKYGFIHGNQYQAELPIIFQLQSEVKKKNLKPKSLSVYFLTPENTLVTNLSNLFESLEFSDNPFYVSKDKKHPEWNRNNSLVEHSFLGLRGKAIARLFSKIEKFIHTGDYPQESEMLSSKIFFNDKAYGKRMTVLFAGGMEENVYERERQAFSSDLYMRSKLAVDLQRQYHVNGQSIAELYKLIGYSYEALGESEFGRKLLLLDEEIQKAKIQTIARLNQQLILNDLAPLPKSLYVLGLKKSELARRVDQFIAYHLNGELITILPQKEQWISYQANPAAPVLSDSILQMMGDVEKITLIVHSA